MTTNSLKIRFVLYKSRRTINGNAPIHCRITYNKMRKSFATGLSANQKDWNSKSQRSEQDEIINQNLEVIKRKLEEIELYLKIKNNALDVEYKATTDKTTIVNLTQHAYFNLSGNFSENILDHKVKINADEFLPVDKTLIPTGELKGVAGTPFDFREAKTVETHIEQKNTQLERGQGYDHCWVLNEQDSGVRFAASAYDEESGRMLEVYTNEPGIQFYTGNFLDGTLPQVNNENNYGYRSGFCLETQHYPDAPNQEGFPSVVLEPGKTYSSKTSFKFTAK